MGIEYTDRNRLDWSNVVFGQLKELGPILSQPQLTCPWGICIPIQYMYRCLVCGVWFCKTCAASHFALEGTI